MPATNTRPKPTAQAKAAHSKYVRSAAASKAPAQAPNPAAEQDRPLALFAPGIELDSGVFVLAGPHGGARGRVVGPVEGGSAEQLRVRVHGRLEIVEPVFNLRPCEQPVA
jgi:hypothetical protein